MTRKHSERKPNNYKLLGNVYVVRQRLETNDPWSHDVAH